MRSQCECGIEHGLKIKVSTSPQPVDKLNKLITPRNATLRGKNFHLAELCDWWKLGNFGAAPLAVSIDVAPPLQDSTLPPLGAPFLSDRSCGSSRLRHSLSGSQRVRNTARFDVRVRGIVASIRITGVLATGK